MRHNLQIPLFILYIYKSVFHFYLVTFGGGEVVVAHGHSHVAGRVVDDAFVFPSDVCPGLNGKTIVFGIGGILSDKIG
jgi:hypothetical protein